ncbi:MAG: class A beta-lactamase, subclass A2 [bacterium]
MRYKFIILLVFVFASPLFAQKDSLRNQIENLIRTKKAKIGVGIYDLGTGDKLTVGGSRHYPMQSVYKFHLALALLKKVDKGSRKLDDSIIISMKALKEDTWSPMRDKYPKGVTLTLREVLRYMISESDNNACDILFKLYGGTRKVERYIKSLGIGAISIRATEAQMHGPFVVQYSNWTTPTAAVLLLKKFYTDHILSEQSTNFLLDAMTQSHNDPDRLKAGLPADAILAHKTGTSGRNRNGMKAAHNDIGIVTLPNGKRYAIAVFVSNSHERDEENSKIIADISKIVSKYFAK